MRFPLAASLVALNLLSPSLCTGSGSPGSSLTDWEQIHQVLNIYALAVDFNQTHQLFPRVFAQDAFANYTGALSNLHGLQNITAALAPDGAKYGAQHSFGTTVIDINKDTTSANVTSYDIATLFGRGTHQGKQVQLYGVYRDTFALIKGQGWRIKTRYYNQMGPPFGDTSVLDG